MQRADLHFHLLPGLDDGASSIDESVELAATAAAEGTRVIVATPHVRPGFVTDVTQLSERVRELAARLEREHLEISVRCGGELAHYMVTRLGQHELDLIANGPRGARWLLVESPFKGLDDEFTAATDELRARGFSVVVAHPERAAGAGFGPGAAAIRHELFCGSLLQVNAWSLAGRHGPEAQMVACDLVATRRAHLVASDAHGGSRQPALSLGVEFAEHAGLDPFAAERLVSVNPLRLLERGLRLPEYAAALAA
jgi:protein-tyrosine phosphatase